MGYRVRVRVGVRVGVRAEARVGARVGVGFRLEVRAGARVRVEARRRLLPRLATGSQPRCTERRSACRPQLAGCAIRHAPLATVVLPLVALRHVALRPHLVG